MPPEATSADHPASSWHHRAKGTCLALALKAFQTLAQISKPCPPAAWTHRLIPSASAPRPSLGLLPPPGPASTSLPPLLHLQNAVCLQSPAQRPPPPGSLRMPPSRWKHPRLLEDLSNLVPSTGWPRLEEMPPHEPLPPLQTLHYRAGKVLWGVGNHPPAPLPPHPHPANGPAWLGRNLSLPDVSAPKSNPPPSLALPTCSRGRRGRQTSPRGLRTSQACRRQSSCGRGSTESGKGRTGCWRVSAAQSRSSPPTLAIQQSGATG